MGWKKVQTNWKTHRQKIACKVKSGDERWGGESNGIKSKYTLWNCFPFAFRASFYLFYYPRRLLNTKMSCFFCRFIDWMACSCLYFSSSVIFQSSQDCSRFSTFHTHIHKLATIIHIYKIKYAIDRHRTRCQQETTKCFYDCFIFDWFSVVCLTVFTLKHLSAAPRITPAKWNARRNWIAWWMDTK